MNTKKICDWTCGVTGSQKNLDLALLLIRLSLAATFIFHGWMKWQDMPGTIGFFGTLGFSPSWAYFVAGLEVLGGAAIGLGVMTRLVGNLLAIMMVVAIYTVHLNNGFSSMAGGYEFQLLLAVCSLAIALVGPGRISLHNKFCPKS